MKGLLIIFLITTLQGASNKNGIEGSYYGSWGQTNWEYHFNSNGTFTFESTGHFGNTLSSGNYYLSNDTLTLNSVESDTVDIEVYHKINNKIFLIDGDSCLIDPATGYDYCKTHLTIIENKNDTIFTINQSRKRIKN